MEHRALTFTDRADAGRQLAKALAALELDHPLIYALPRGGVPVAVEIAKASICAKGPKGPMDRSIAPCRFRRVSTRTRQMQPSRTGC